MKLFLLSFAAMLMLTSCDYGYTLVVNNHTGKTQRIKYISFYRFPIGDSINSWSDTAAQYPGNRPHYKNIPIYKNTTERSVSFSLDNDRSVELERGINGSINPDASLIVNETDTIRLNGDKRATVKKIGMFKAYSGFVSLK